MNMKKAAVVTICLLLVFALTAGCVEKKPTDTGGIAPATLKNGNAGIVSPTPVDFGNEVIEGRKASVQVSYKDVYKALELKNQSFGYEMGRAENALVDVAEADMDAPAPMPSSAPMLPPETAAGDATVTSKDGGYSETNVQVKGVDEGDIVKTDGEYIYVLRPYVNEKSELTIFKADGESTTIVSTFTVCKTNSDFKPYNEKDGYSSFNESASELYLFEDTLAVVTNYNGYSESSVNGLYRYENTQMQKVYIYDIADRTHPTLKATLGQDGYGIASRLIGDTLYLISNYYIYNYDFDEARPETYIPRLYIEGAAKLIPEDCIAIFPNFSSTAYTVVCSYDLTDASLTDTKTTLGGGSTVYMNGSSLYVAAGASVQTDSEPRKESIYKVIERKTQEVTDITRYDVSDGNISLAASGTIPGYLNNQFSFDEYEGHLRAVTSTFAHSWTEYTDEEFGWTNYKYGESARHNALFILDSSLNITGSIENLAENETVQSVRFFGDVGYFVTFERVDPLFAVDLADPANPVILSELKIPGFSQYMHGFSEDRLFGLGMDADPQTGVTTTMKLSMFDTTDLRNVTEKHTLVLDSYYSNALYNHKAILISEEKNIIAFPSDKGYDIYGYSDDSGFYKRASVTGIDWYGDSRGLYIGDYVYVIVSDRVSIMEMDGFNIVKNIRF